MGNCSSNRRLNHNTHNRQINEKTTAQASPAPQIPGATAKPVALANVHIERPKYQALIKAQKMVRTENGQDVNRSTAPLMTASGIDMICNDPKISDEKRLVLLPPFSNMDRVTDNLYLTSLGGLTMENFIQYQISCVINATHDLPILNNKSIQTYRIPVDDDVVEDILQYFDDVADKIEEISKNGGKTVVHCMAGVSRSTTLVLAYLIKYHNMTTRDAFLNVRKIRPCVRPNIAFIGQLIAYEEKLKGNCSSSIVKFVYKNRIIRIPDFYETDCPDLYQVELAKQTATNSTTNHDIVSTTSQSSSIVADNTPQPLTKDLKN